MINSLHPIKMDKRLKVCAYCRISSDKDEQETSLLEQITYYSDLIIDNDKWEFAGIFADDGISGTSTIQRKQFQLMINKAKTGGIDIIITKSISRFARNVTDLLETIHDLRKIGVEVYFERENFSSLDSKSDTMLTIYAKFAEEESNSISKNVGWRYEINKRNGSYFLNMWQLLGFAYNEKKEIIIVENEAKWIRKIFQMYLDDIPVRRIAEFLEENNVRAPCGGTKWNNNTIRSILKNEKYVGDCLMQKKITVDNKRHIRKVNQGEVDQVYVENGHPAIIDRETWNRCLEKRKIRVEKYKIRSNKEHKNKTIYTGFITCAHCGKNYYLKTSTHSKRKIFYCASNREVLTCRKSESIFMDLFENCMNEQVSILLSNITELKTALLSAYYDALRINEQDERLIALDSQIKALTERYETYKGYTDEAMLILKADLKSKIQNLMKEKLLIQNNKLTYLSPENITNEYIYYLKGLKKIVSVEDYDFKKIFSKVIIIDRSEIRFIIGNEDTSKIDLSKEPTFKGSIKYKERQTWFTTNFGIIINA